MDFLKKMYELSKKRALSLEPFSGDFKLPGRPFKAVLRSMAIIAEVKYATPAEGDLGIKDGPGELAKKYEASGASAISCLTEPAYFKGDLKYIREIRSVSKLPILMKDFIVDEQQIVSGRANGADAFLLITEMLTLEELKQLFEFGKGLGMDALVEVHSLEGLEKAIHINADIIGVNSRDLATLKIIPERHDELISHIPKGAIKVAESGISSGQRLAELKKIGYDAALVGRAVVSEKTRADVFSCG